MSNNSELNQVEDKDILKKNEQIQQQFDDYEKDLEEGKNIIDKLHIQVRDHHQEIIQQLSEQKYQIAKISNSVQQKIQPNYKRQWRQANDKTDQRAQPAEPQQSKQQQLDISKNMSKKASKLLQGCNCQKSKCTKNYCQCFTQGKRCNELCKCTGCQNHSENQNRFRQNIDADEGERACFCKKSNCLKKYCECYNNGLKCSVNCKCQQCKNTEDKILQEIQAEQVIQERKQRSQQQIQEINSKINQINRITLSEHKQLMLSFLEYWLS